MNLQNAGLSASCVEVIYSLFSGFANAAHSYDYLCSVGRAVVVKRLVLSARKLRDLAHVFVYDIRNRVVELVRGLSALEVDIAVLSRTSDNRVLRVKSVILKRFKSVPINQTSEIVVIHNLYLLDLVRSSESVEEMQERNSRLDRREMRHAAQVHNLLDAVGSQHSETCLTTSHNVLMVAEDVEGVSRQSSRAYVEYRREQLARDLIHIRYHK